MSAVVDTSVLIDILRGRQEARSVLEREWRAGPLHASEITTLETLAGMREAEEVRTRLLLNTPVWHPVDAAVAEKAGEIVKHFPMIPDLEPPY